MNKRSMTLKDLNEFAIENGLSEDVELFVFGKNMLRAVTGIFTEVPSEEASYTDLYLEAEEEPLLN